MIILWWTNLEYLEIAGGLFTLLLICYAVIRYFLYVRSAARRLAESSDRVDEVRLEQPIFLPALLIGTMSWASVYYLDMDAYGTLAVNASIASFSRYSINFFYARRLAREVEHGVLDESIVIEEIERDAIHIAWGKALVAGIGIGAIVAHADFGVSNVQLLEHQSMRTALEWFWRVVLIPFLVFWAMTVTGKIDTVWTLKEMFLRELRWRRKMTCDNEDKGNS